MSIQSVVHGSANMEPFVTKNSGNYEAFASELLENLE